MKNIDTHVVSFRVHKESGEIAGICRQWFPPVKDRVEKMLQVGLPRLK